MLRQEHPERALAKDLQRVCADLERRLGAGEACSADTIFAAHPEFAATADAALEVIYTEFVAREHLGQRPAPDDFCARFPQWRDGLEQLFQIHVAVGDNSAAVSAGSAGTPFPDMSRWRSAS